MHEILEHAKKFSADLLVAGITGAGDSPAGTGSVSGKLARKAVTGVLLVRADHPGAFRKAVACIDFSDTSREVAAQAAFGGGDPSEALGARSLRRTRRMIRLRLTDRGEEILAYQTLDATNGEIRVATSGRGMLGTRAQAHQLIGDDVARTEFLGRGRLDGGATGESPVQRRPTGIPTRQAVLAVAGRPVTVRAGVKVSSDRPVNEPFVDLVIDATWATGRITRSYTMLFDPPALRRAAPAVTAAPPILSLIHISEPTRPY